MVIGKLPADLGIPERTPVAVSKVNPAGTEVVAVKVEGASVVMVWFSATPAVADTAALEVKAGPVAACTVTVKLPVAVFPVSELDAVKVKVKGPLILNPGERVMMPVAALIEAQLGFEVSV
jgi:hypothetical protein